MKERKASHEPVRLDITSVALLISPWAVVQHVTFWGASCQALQTTNRRWSAIAPEVAGGIIEPGIVKYPHYITDPRANAANIDSAPWSNSGGQSEADYVGSGQLLGIVIIPTDGPGNMMFTCV